MSAGWSHSASMKRPGLSASSSVRVCSQKSVGTMPAASQRNPSRSNSRTQCFNMSIM